MTSEEKGLSLNEIRRRVDLFVVSYKSATSEKQEAEGFWRALMAAYGVDYVNQRGVLFQKPARRADTGGDGFIDVFLPNKFLIEHKSEGKLTRRKGSELSNAEEQAEAYIAGGSISGVLPRYVVTSDFAVVEVTDRTRPRTDPRRTLRIKTEDLSAHVEDFLFLTGHDADLIIRADQAEASVKAALLMGDLFTTLTHDADTDDEDDPKAEDEATLDASILLTRLLFLMFGDDAGLWDRGLFHRFVVERTASDGSDLKGQLEGLFEALDTPEPERDSRMEEAVAQFPYVNGALFKRGAMKMPWFDAAMRQALVNACDFDWSRISPAVFGSLFQTVHSKEARDAGGEHYTSEENILKTLGPLFLDDLRSQLDKANTKPQLEVLHAQLKNLRYADPACGCGNFLIVAYREMRQLELDLLVKLRTKQGRGDVLQLDPSHMLNVTLDQFTGIEIKWWPAKIAETAMFLVDHQANRRMADALGISPIRLPINIAANIFHANALVNADGARREWSVLIPNASGSTTYVFGNPPFLGDHSREESQLAELQAVWGEEKTLSRMDYVTGWYAQALRYFLDREGEFAFVSTNSVAQGDQVHRLFQPIYDAGWRIKFAHRTFAWTSEAASKERAVVHCVILGFTRDRSVKPRLFDYPTLRGAPDELRVPRVNAYLVDGPDVWVEKRMRPLSSDLPMVDYGSKPADGGGFLITTKEELEQVMNDVVAAKYVRRFVGAKELLYGIDRWCLWLVDVEPGDVDDSPILRSRIEAVRDFRRRSKAATTRAYQHHHLFRQIGQPSVPYLGIPEVASEQRRYIPTTRFPADVIASNKVYTCPDPDGFAFGVVSSSMFRVWQVTVGGRLKSDPSFSSTIVWNNLPLPSIDRAARKAIITAGQGIDAARALHPARSLAEHYNPLSMSRELIQAHNALDKVVDKAFGAGRARLNELGRQELLFTRYLELTASD